MGKSVDELTSYMRPLCLEFLARAAAAGIAVTLVDTGRTESQQEQNIVHGVSWTLLSKHLPQPPEMLSEAFDGAPTAYLSMKGWNPTGPLWAQLGAIGEGLGLRWGGRWAKHPDPSHYEWFKPPVDLEITT